MVLKPVPNSTVWGRGRQLDRGTHAQQHTKALSTLHSHPLNTNVNVHAFSIETVYSTDPAQFSGN